MRRFSYIQLFCLAGFQILLVFAFLARVNEIENYFRYNTGLLKINFPDDESVKNGAINSFTGPGMLAEWKSTEKEFITVRLTGDISEDNRRLDFVRTEARRLAYTCDTTHILKVHFISENTYGQFIQLASMLHADRHKRYTFYNDDFYILGEPPPTDE